jgi:hypothetical protein
MVFHQPPCLDYIAFLPGIFRLVSVRGHYPTTTSYIVVLDVDVSALQSVSILIGT